MPWTFYTPLGEIKRTDAANLKAWGHISWSKFITGNTNTTFVAGDTASRGVAGGFVVSGNGLVIPKSAMYRIDLQGWLSNTQAGTTGVVVLSGSTSGQFGAVARLHVPVAAGTDEGASVVGRALVAGETLTAYGGHSDGSSSRQMTGEVLVTEL